MAADWRLILCDLNGNAIANVSAIASGKALSFILNRPAACRFQVPADDERIAGDHTDSLPRLVAGRRTLKAYRRRRAGDPYVLRFNGVVWAVQDAGGGEEATCAVTCFDPLIRLSRRFTGRRRVFTNVDGAVIAKTLVDEANAVAATGITTAGNVQEGTPLRTPPPYEFRQVADAITELASAFNSFDFELVPLDRTDGVMARMDFYLAKGTTRPDAVFSWGLPPHNVASIERLEDMEPVANAILGVGATGTNGDPLLSPLSQPSDLASKTMRENAAAIAAFGRYEAVETFSDVQTQAFLDALVDDELAFRLQERELVQVTPQPGRAPEPWADYWLGDQVAVHAGPRLRGGFSGFQRIYGLDLTLEEDGRESSSSFYAVPQ